MDVLLVGFIAGFVYGGWRSGFVRRVVGLALMAVSLVAGAYIRGPAGAVVTAIFPKIPTDYADLVGYTVAFPLILVIAHLIAHPFLKDRKVGAVSEAMNKALGAIFGGIEALLILSAVVVILDTYFATNAASGSTPGLTFFTQFRASFNASETVQLLRTTTVPLVETILGPLLPKDISSLLPSGLPTLPGGLPIPK